MPPKQRSPSPEEDLYTWSQLTMIIPQRELEFMIGDRHRKITSQEGITYYIISKERMEALKSRK